MRLFTRMQGKREKKLLSRFSTSSMMGSFVRNPLHAGVSSISRAATRRMLSD